MSAKLKYGFLCDGAMVVHGKWTYQGIFTAINCIAFPTIHTHAVLAMQFTGPVGAHAIRFSLVDSGGKPILPEFRQVMECLEFVDSTVMVNLDGIPLPTEGFYSFKVYLDQDVEPFGTIEFRTALIRQKPGLAGAPQGSP